MCRCKEVLDHGKVFYRDGSVLAFIVYALKQKATSVEEINVVKTGRAQVVFFEPGQKRTSQKKEEKREDWKYASQRQEETNPVSSDSRITLLYIIAT